MFYKGLIFDLDNTLYSYSHCHSIALKNAIEYLVSISKNTFSEIKKMYDVIDSELKIELQNTASSHNKSIYFKQLIEWLGINYSHFSKVNELYWNSFYDNLNPFNYVIEFLKWNKLIGIKIGILTDYESEYQIIKLEKLGLLEYIDYVLTSEEVGIEKPSSKMFYKILDKMNLSVDSVIMFGDNYEKDIKGSNMMNIRNYWIHNDNPDINNFEEIYYEFKNIYKSLNDLKYISKYCGERFDLVQAGGGNISVKTDAGDLMFIKASGYNLSNIDEKNGYVVIDNKVLKSDISNDVVKDITKYNFIGNKRGSIETYMHSILKKYTVHLHPIQINKILISKNARELINKIYPNGLIIEYLTPGIKVCESIRKEYNNESVIFLLNHGIIITDDNIENIYILINDLTSRFEKFQNVCFEKYRFTNQISSIINSKYKLTNITYLCEDAVINNYFLNKNELFNMDLSFPDALIYCGVKILFGLEKLDEYFEDYDESPKIIIENGNIYINSHSLNKCKEIEDVLKSNLIILDTTYEKNYLSLEEICYLNNWDAEKYRKNLF